AKLTAVTQSPIRNQCAGPGRNLQRLAGNSSFEHVEHLALQGGQHVEAGSSQEELKREDDTDRRSVLAMCGPLAAGGLLVVAPGARPRSSDSSNSPGWGGRDADSGGMDGEGERERRRARGTLKQPGPSNGTGERSKGEQRGLDGRSTECAGTVVFSNRQLTKSFSLHQAIVLSRPIG
ncbi:hypothetical protein BaRGS_00034837, partial [Batillaria attramentaria]